MQILTKEEFEKQKESIKKQILNGAVFIYPTDTIYGIGCDATNDESVKKVREIKNREDNPFSIVAPSKIWIDKNCIINENAKSWIKRLPGPYTLILKITDNIINIATLE